MLFKWSVLGWNDRPPPTFAKKDSSQEPRMDKEHVKGAYDKAKGAVKETVGKATGDKNARQRVSSIRPRERPIASPAT